MKKNPSKSPIQPPSAAAGCFFSNGGQDDFPVRPDLDGNHIEVHQGGIVYAEGKYWWFGMSYRDAAKGKNKWPATGIGVEMYSSEDLFRWKHEGVVMPCQPSGDLAAPLRIERPKILFNRRTRKYVMWSHYIGGQGDDDDLVGPGRSEAGVASCERVNGLYHWHGHQRPLGPHMTVKDCTLFEDDDGAAYFLFDSYPNDRSATRCLHLARLSDDYLGIVEIRKIANAEHREAPILFKRRGYYFLLTSGTSFFYANAARCHRARHIFGPYEDLGNFCRGAGSEVTFNSQGVQVIQVRDYPDAFIFAADRWNTQEDMRRSAHIWLPLEFPRDDTVELRYHCRWDLGVFALSAQSLRRPHTGTRFRAGGSDAFAPGSAPG